MSGFVIKPGATNVYLGPGTFVIRDPVFINVVEITVAKAIRAWRARFSFASNNPFRSRRR